MPSITTDLSDEAYTGLGRVVTRYNADNSTALSVEAWVDLHLRELSVQDQVFEAAQELQRQAEETTKAALAAERLRLLESVAVARA